MKWVTQKAVGEDIRKLLAQYIMTHSYQDRN